MDITPASLRDASFTLTPTGCNPVQVEETLAEIAEHLTNDTAIPRELLEREFEQVSAGFSPDEVADLLATLRNALGDPAATVATVLADNAEADKSQPHPEPEPAPRPMAAAAPTRPAGPGTTSSLPEAVERTKLAVSELETFVAHQLGEAKAALRLQIDQTQTDCQNTLDTARTVSDRALDTARQRAEVLLDAATRTTEQLRNRFDSELATMRAAFEDDLTRGHGAIRADLEALVAEARELTREAHAELVAVQEDVHASLDDARTVLSASQQRAA